MKLNKVAALCKQNNTVTLYNKRNADGSVAQWIGTRGAMYPAGGLPHMTAENILTIFDIPEDKHSKWRCHDEDMPVGYCYSDTDDSETEVKAGTVSVISRGDTLRPLWAGDDVVFINTDYLSPLSDLIGDYTLYKRIRRDGQAYIVAKVGFIIHAIILPHLFGDPAIEQLEAISKAYRGEQQRRHDDEFKDYFAEIEQILFNANEGDDNNEEA